MGAAVHADTTQIMTRPASAAPKSRWFLTDMPEPDMGHFCVIPGSHRLGFPRIPAGLDHALKLTSSRYEQLEDICEGCPGAKQFTLKRGDAVVFHNALFHAVSRNTSSVWRAQSLLRIRPVVGPA